MDITICSIFVNPTQFNNAADFEKYPMTIEKDIIFLESAGCDVLFLPSAQEMYPPNDPVIFYDLGYIETLLEGKYRPGHFQGVCRIVDKLLDAVTPDKLYLGQKDYQQCMVIQKMIELKQYPTQLVICETVREPDGLAKSSRNIRLDKAGRKQALFIIETLRTNKQKINDTDPDILIEEAEKSLTLQGFKVDYVAIADANNLQPVEIKSEDQKKVALIAAFINDIRLIDNLLLN
jgi:pantoate--beta-alanine ligase